MDITNDSEHNRSRPPGIGAIRRDAGRRRCYAFRMKNAPNARMSIFSKTLECLIESLDATVRMDLLDAGTSPPDPLRESAAHLVARLGTADRLVTGHFKGSVSDIARVNAMIDAMRRLDIAYVAYRQRVERKPAERDSAATALDAEIHKVKAEAAWAA